jgi:hypothetical protein
MNPTLRHLGFKSAGRRLFEAAGVPVPYGVEDVRSTDDLLAAIAAIQAARPLVERVVVKHDDSGAGDGNVVLDVRNASGAPAKLDTMAQRIAALPEWYLRDLGQGGIAEEFLDGAQFSSPSAQVDLLPDGGVVVLATHEQLLGGDSGQIFLGCRFPADAAYAGELARYAQLIGERLAASGVVGRISVDFAAVRTEGESWRLYALEVNLRKGGTTHPYAVLRNLVPGRYDAHVGAWVTGDGSPRAYVCTDNLVDSSWVGSTDESVIHALEAAGLRFDRRTGTGVILHMLSGLGIDGRIGLTAFEIDVEQAQALYERACDAVRHTLASDTPTAPSLPSAGGSSGAQPVSPPTP